MGNKQIVRLNFSLFTSTLNKKKKRLKKGTVAQIWISIYEIQTLVKVTDISTTPCVGYVEGRFLHISGIFFFFNSFSSGKMDLGQLSDEALPYPTKIQYCLSSSGQPKLFYTI